MAGSCAVALYLLVSWLPAFISERHDRGFTYMAHHHFARGIPWGTVGMHTSGVWGLVRFPEYVRETFWVLVAGQAATALALGSVLGLVASRCLRRTGLGIALVLGSLWACMVSDDARWFLILLSYLLFLPDFTRRRTTPGFLALTAMVAFAFHVKGTFMIPILLLILVVGILEVRAGRLPVNVLALVAAIFALNAAAHSTPAMMWRHFRFVLGSTAGNPEVFSRVGPASEVAVFLAIEGAFMGLVLLVELRKDRRVGALLFTAYGLVTWMVYKTGFSRHDDIHVGRAYYTLLPFMVWYLLVNRATLAEAVAGSRFWSSPWGRRAALSLAAAVAIASVGTLSGLEEIHDRKLSHFAGQLEGIRLLLTRGLLAFDQRDVRHARRIQRRHPIPSYVHGPVGVYGQMQTPVIARGLENVPLPIIAAYEVWAPEEAERTNAFLRSRDAPPNLIVTSTGHSASNAITIAERYDRLSAWPGQIFLRRRRVPRTVHLDPVLAARVTWEQRIEVPEPFQGELLMARFVYRGTLANRLVTFLYQPPRAFLDLENGGALVARLRLNRLLMQDGLMLVSHAVSDWDSKTDRVQYLRHDLLSEIVPLPPGTAHSPPSLFEVSRPNPRPITHLRFRGGSDAAEEWPFPATAWPWYFEPEIDVELFRVRFSEPGRAAR